MNRMQAIALVTLLAFMVNVMLPFAALARLASFQQRTELSSFFADQKVPVCTPEGFVWMTWEEVQQAGNTHHSSGYHCPLSAAGMVVLQQVMHHVAAALFMPVQYVLQPAFSTAEEHWQESYAFIAPPNRAPPVKV